MRRTLKPPALYQTRAQSRGKGDPHDVHTKSRFELDLKPNPLTRPKMSVFPIPGSTYLFVRFTSVIFVIIRQIKKRMSNSDETDRLQPNQLTSTLLGWWVRLWKNWVVRPVLGGQSPSNMTI